MDCIQMHSRGLSREWIFDHSVSSSTYSTAISTPTPLLRGQEPFISQALLGYQQSCGFASGVVLASTQTKPFTHSMEESIEAIPDPWMLSNASPQIFDGNPYPHLMQSREIHQFREAGVADDYHTSLLEEGMVVSGTDHNVLKHQDPGGDQPFGAQFVFARMQN